MNESRCDERLKVRVQEATCHKKVNGVYYEIDKASVKDKTYI
jgi:hypothetical protein